MIGNVTQKLLLYVDNKQAGFAQYIWITAELLRDITSKPATVIEMYQRL